MKTSTRVAAEVSWAQVHAFRLRRHHLTNRRGRAGLDEVARDICGAQAQVMSAAELQIAVRTGGKAADTRKALWDERSLVKTWLMRGTLHLIPADDLPLFTAAMQGRWVRVRNSWLTYMQMTEAELTGLIEEIGQTMTGAPMTRQEILGRVGARRSERVRELLRSGWGGMLKPVARRGLLCFGPSRGQSVTFVNPRQWLASWRKIEPEHAITEVARRYLRAYGPATRSDFARWWGASTGVAKIAWSGLAGEISTVSVAGKTADILSGDLTVLQGAKMPGSVVMLPPFDPYLMGHASRDHLFERSHASSVSRTAGWISAVVLVEGRVGATWTASVTDKVMRFTVTPFQRVSPAVDSGIRERAAQIAAAVGTRADVKVSRPSGRP